MDSHTYREDARGARRRKDGPVKAAPTKARLLGETRPRRPEPPPETQRVATAVVDAAFTVHSALGPGLLESIYEKCLAHELKKRGLDVRTQVVVPLIYDGTRLEEGLRLDVVVNDRVLLEVKAVESLLPVHEAQILSYLRLSGIDVGFLINFNVPLIKQGIRRFLR